MHNIIRKQNEDGTEAFELLVSKYSFLSNIRRCTPGPTAAREDSNGTSDQELLLHFRSYHSMGQREDAEVINIKEIVHTEHLTESPESLVDIIEYRASVPKGLFYEIPENNS